MRRMDKRMTDGKRELLRAALAALEMRANEEVNYVDSAVASVVTAVEPEVPQLPANPVRARMVADAVRRDAGTRAREFKRACGSLIS